MLKEIFHCLYHAPHTLSLVKNLPRAQLYEKLMEKGEAIGMAEWRASLVNDLQGLVLEIGCGTGLMFQYYPENVKVVALEYDPEFLELAIPKAQKTYGRIRLIRADGEKLPLQSHIFDAVIIVLVLCSVPSTETVLGEVRRVLKPGGELRLIEHVRSPKPVSGFFMDLFNGLWLKINRHGCHMNRRTEELLQQNGFKLQIVRPFKILTPGIPSFPLRWMIAKP